MLVYLESLGSVWQESLHQDRGTRIWNTTGVHDGVRFRPRSKLFGQVRLGSHARIELNKYGQLKPGIWITSELSTYKGIPGIQLQRHERAGCVPEWYLVTVTETLVGVFPDGFFNPEEVRIVSHSVWKDRQEAMLLMRPFAYVKGEHGTATLIPQPRGCAWRTAAWVQQ